MAVKPKKLRSLHYSKALVICHGLSELQITKYIYTNLHLPVRTYAKDNGKNSIQITSLLNLLSSAPFGSPTQFCDEYTVQTKGSGNKQRLVYFKVFIIMDTDDCTDQQKADFMDGKMFSEHWLSPYIVPIANIPDLETVFEKAKLIRKIKSSEKGTYYSETFPINKGQLNPGTVAEIEAFCDKLEKRKDTNLNEPYPLAVANIRVLLWKESHITAATTLIVFMVPPIRARTHILTTNYTIIPFDFGTI